MLPVDIRRSLSRNVSIGGAFAFSLSVVICVVADSVPGFRIELGVISNDRSECKDTFRLFGNMSAFVNSFMVCVEIEDDGDVDE